VSDESIFDKDVSRREAMKTAAKGAAYAAPVVLAATVPGAVSAATPAPASATDAATKAAKIKAIFTVARTAEQLAVTFYSNGIKNAAALGLTATQFGQIQAALVEEQLHQILFTAQGGDSLADTFSFPQGAKTFTDLATFIATQQILEGVFDSAFLAAVREFSEIGESRLAQIASQIACIESEHRTLGRSIGGLEPADNWTYAPVQVSFVADAPQAVKDAGFLSPVPGNTFKYVQVDTSTPGIMFKDGPFSKRSGSGGTPGTAKSIFTVARTAEQLAVTFYSNGLANAQALGLNATEFGQIEAALVEEQLHQILFTAQGGDSLADTFSFPDGATTFTDRATFIKTQQILEGVFDSAFLAAVREFSETGQHRTAQIASQIACIESEHRALGRQIGGLEPADNWTYAPVQVSFVADAPQAVKDAGFLSPVPGNTFKYVQQDTTAPGIMFKDGPFSKRP